MTKKMRRKDRGHQRHGGESGAAGGKLEGLAQAVVETARKKKDPEMQVPARVLSNVAFNEKTRHIEMGSAKQARNFFDTGPA